MSVPKSTPKDAQVMAAILKDMGVIEYEPRIINEMLEFTYRYVTNILDDARLFSSHAKKKALDVDDVRLAIHLQMDKSFTTPPPRELLLEIARQKNSTPLPLIKPNAGPRLPPDRYSLTSCNYRLKSVKKPRVQMGIATPRLSITSLQSSNTGLSGVSKVSPAVSLSSKTGATLSVVTKAVSSPTVTIVSRAAVNTPVSKTVPTPIIKLSEGSGVTTSIPSCVPGNVPAPIVTTSSTPTITKTLTIPDSPAPVENSNKRKLEDDPDDYDAE